MNKRSIVVFDGELMYLPPIATLMMVLKNVGEDPVLICTDHFTNPKYVKQFGFTVEFVRVPTYMASFRRHPIKRIMNALQSRRHYLTRRKAFWVAIDKYARAVDYTLWTLNTPTLEILGDRASHIGRRHIHLCYELEDDLLTKKRWFSPKKLLSSATLVQCEENRADIMAAMYKLVEKPFVLPNKPLPPICKGDIVSVNKDVASIVAGWKDKFVFFYQGMLGPDRVGLVKVMEWLCEAFPNDIVALQTHIKGFSFEKLLKYNNFCVVPPLVAPNHLLVTAHANVGLAFYVTNDKICSPLNAIYCAPNKIYEYALFGLPTMGNDIPGLRYAVEYKHAGICFKRLAKEDVVLTARRIKDNYASFSAGAKRMYESIDLCGLVNSINSFARSGHE